MGFTIIIPSFINKGVHRICSGQMALAQTSRWSVSPLEIAKTRSVKPDSHGKCLGIALATMRNTWQSHIAASMEESIAEDKACKSKIKKATKLAEIFTQMFPIIGMPCCPCVGTGVSGLSPDQPWPELRMEKRLFAAAIGISPQGEWVSVNLTIQSGA